MKSKLLLSLVLVILAVITIIPRLYRISTPMADWHSWRQVDTVAVTRYLIEDNFDVLHPRYQDISRIQTGYENPQGLRFVEFPIFNLIHAVIFLSTPLSLEVSARVVSILAAIVTAWTLFFIGKKMSSFWSGAWTAIVYAILPFSVYFTRIALPDPLSTAFGLLGAYLFWEYFDTNKKLFLYSAALSFSIGLLVKPYALFFGIPVALLALEKWGLRKTIINGGIILVSIGLAPLLYLKEYVEPTQLPVALLLAVLLMIAFVIRFWDDIRDLKHEYIALIIIVTPLALWRGWMQTPENLVGIPFNQWLLNGDGIRFRPSWWFWIFGERVGKLISGYWGLALLGAGIFSAKSKKVLLYLGIAAFAYVSIFATANVKHDYYQTFILPFVALAMGHGIYSIFAKRYLNKIYAALLVACVLGLAVMLSFYWVRENYKINDYAMLDAAARMQEISNPDDLIIAPYNGNTVFLYYTGRRGWPVVTTNIDQLIDWGAKYYVSTSKGDTDSVNFKNRFELVEETDQYIILKLVDKT